MKSMCLAALTGALAISTWRWPLMLRRRQLVAAFIAAASTVLAWLVLAWPCWRGSCRNRVGRAGIGYGRAGIGYGRWAGYRPGYGLGYRPGYGLGAGCRCGRQPSAPATIASGGYDAYASGDASAAYASADVGTGDAYILRGTYISESDAVAYCAQQFRSYDIASRTFLAYSGERVSCPQ